MKAKLEVSLEHPVMFLSDPYAEDLAPLDIGDNLIASTESCIAFRVRSYIEGGADVTISSEEHPSLREPNYKKAMNLKSGVVSVSDSGRFNYCMFPVEGSQVYFEIWNSTDDSVWIRISPLIEY
jgi:hypothetical protein